MTKYYNRRTPNTFLLILLFLFNRSPGVGPKGGKIAKVSVGWAFIRARPTPRDMDKVFLYTRALNYESLTSNYAVRNQLVVTGSTIGY